VLATRFNCRLPMGKRTQGRGPPARLRLFTGTHLGTRAVSSQTAPHCVFPLKAAQVIAGFITVPDGQGVVVFSDSGSGRQPRVPSILFWYNPSSLMTTGSGHYRGTGTTISQGLYSVTVSYHSTGHCIWSTFCVQY